MPFKKKLCRYPVKGSSHLRPSLRFDLIHCPRSQGKHTFLVTATGILPIKLTFKLRYKIYTNLSVVVLCAYVCIQVLVCALVFVCVRVLVSVCMYFLCVCVCLLFMCVCVRALVCVCLFVCMYLCVRVRVSFMEVYGSTQKN